MVLILRFIWKEFPQPNMLMQLCFCTSRLLKKSKLGRKQVNSNNLHRLSRVHGTGMIANSQPSQTATLKEILQLTTAQFTKAKCFMLRTNSEQMLSETVDLFPRAVRHRIQVWSKVKEMLWLGIWIHFTARQIRHPMRQPRAELSHLKMILGPDAICCIFTMTISLVKSQNDNPQTNLRLWRHISNTQQGRINEINKM